MIALYLGVCAKSSIGFHLNHVVGPAKHGPLDNRTGVLGPAHELRG